jgi:hypothetical protein
MSLADQRDRVLPQRALAVALGELRFLLDPWYASNDTTVDVDAARIPEVLRRAYTAALVAGYPREMTVELLAAMLKRSPNADAARLTQAWAAVEQLRARELGTAGPT